MALKRRRDNTMWQEHFNFYFIVILSGLLYLILFVTSEPVCYTQISHGELNLNIKRVDCNGTETICKRFASKKDVKVGDLLNSPCMYPETHKKNNKAITCQDAHLPTVNAGHFNCSGHSVGDTCPLTCDDDYYPSATKVTVCEEYDDYKANWTVGKFQCSEITCSTKNLPMVEEGSFDCVPNTDISKGEACNVACNDGFYPAYPGQAVCEKDTTNQGGVWSDGSFVCLAIACQEVHLPTVNAGFFNCSGYYVGDKCTLTCDDDYYPSATKYAVCEEYDDHKANWTVGKFQCSAITCWTTNLPTVTEGYFDCAPNSTVSKGEVCSLKCNDRFYPAYSNQTVCETGTTNQGGVWSNGSFVCREYYDWNEWNGSEYKLTSNLQTWEESRQLCESDNAHLVIIENREENEFLYKMVRHFNRGTFVAIGLNDINTEGMWEWIDGTVSAYRNWHEGEPNIQEEDCGFLKRYNGEWYDWGCHQLGLAICERNNNNHLTYK